MGADPLPQSALAALRSVELSLSPREMLYARSQLDFFGAVTDISALLRAEKDKEHHPDLICKRFSELSIPAGCYMPTRPDRLVLSARLESASPMQSAAKCPFLLEFRTLTWGGPDRISISTDQRKLRATDATKEEVKEQPTEEPGQGALEAGRSRVEAKEATAAITSPKRVLLEFDSEDDNEDQDEDDQSHSTSS